MSLKHIDKLVMMMEPYADQLREWSKGPEDMSLEMEDLVAMETYSYIGKWLSQEQINQVLEEIVG
jgi:hypothetical protein